MKAVIRIGSAVGLAVCIALLISWIGELDGNLATEEGEPLSVFSNHRTRTLSAETIVDELTALGLNHSLRRVSLHASTLEVDIDLKARRTDEQGVFADMGALASLALAESSNVARVFVRVFEPERSGTGGGLLMAMTGAKSAFRDTELQRLRDGERMPEEWIRERMRLTVTERWRELFEAP